MSPSNEEWSPDLISDAVRTPQPIRLISDNEPGPTQYSYSGMTNTRIKEMFVVFCVPSLPNFTKNRTRVVDVTFIL